MISTLWVRNRRGAGVSWARDRRACRRRTIPRGRCSLCGRSIEKHGVVLIAVHEFTRERECRSRENLCLLCEECNAGRECSLEPSEPAWMTAVIAHENVHMRLGETLKAFQGEPIPAATLKRVADQDAWTTRIRELRYLGWEIEAIKRRLPVGRVSSFYRLKKWKAWPPDPTGTIWAYEQARAKRNRSSR